MSTKVEDEGNFVRLQLFWTKLKLLYSYIKYSGHRNVIFMLLVPYFPLLNYIQAHKLL